jgi:anaerobic selenocysteine-containing dehydrogenase
VPDGLNLDKVKAHPHGLDLGPLDAGMLPRLLATPDKMIDLAPPQLLTEVPRMQAALAELEKPGSLVMIGRRQHRSKNAWMHNIHLLAKGKERCTLLVNPADAKRLGIATGSRARLKTRIAEIEPLVEVSDEIMPGVVSLPHGWGHVDSETQQRVANAHPGVNANSIIDEAALDLPSASTILNGVPVELEAIRI